MEIVQWNIVL